MRLVSAIALTLWLGIVHAAAGQVLQPGLQPGLTRAPGGARKISLNEAIRMANQNAPASVQAEGMERTSRATKVSAIGAIMPSLSLSAGRVIQFGGGQTRVNSNGEQVTIEYKPLTAKVYCHRADDWPVDRRSHAERDPRRVVARNLSRKRHLRRRG